MYKAGEIRRVSQLINSSRGYADERNTVCEAIRQAAEKGHFLAIVPLVLTDTVANEFRADGFVVVVKMDSTEIIW